LLAEFKKSVDCASAKFLLPRATIADKSLARQLEDLGGIVDDLDAYATVPETDDRTGHRALLLKEGADFLTFTSSSTVTNFCALVDAPGLLKRFPGIKVVSIGPQTTKAAKELNVPVAMEAGTHTIAGMVNEICNAVKRES
jgi:uroporphyrinogen III methyltransferase/synthase